ncbi:MAG: DUF58 domain-containing protein [Bacteroidetes bacterium]|nr:DUF58 domain-containing protein [Bacteroidota bacterium]
MQIVPQRRFYVLLTCVIVLAVLSFGWPILFWPANFALALVLAATAADALLLISSGQRLEIIRQIPEVLSMGYPHEVRLVIRNNSVHKLSAEIIDEMPVQLQKRDFSIHAYAQPESTIVLNYKMRPLTRGVYKFGLVRVLRSGMLGLVSIRLSGGSEQQVAVYPSIMEMKQLEMSAFSTLTQSGGIRKIRRLGHSYVFEQIRDYVKGDEFRSINWKATGRRGKLMINQYEDERSQQIIQVIDRSRVMQLPFNGLTLLDYSVNAALAISNIALRKHDKAGLLLFSSSKLQFVAPESRRSQMSRILEVLYNAEESKLDSGFELLYTGVRNSIERRSLLFLYTNFESVYSLERALPILRKLNRLHLLVVISFENIEISRLAETSAVNLEEVYAQTIAQKYLGEKLSLFQILRQHGIQSIFTKPENLSVHVANKYLELKARGLI